MRDKYKGQIATLTAKLRQAEGKISQLNRQVGATPPCRNPLGARCSLWGRLVGSPESSRQLPWRSQVELKDADNKELTAICDDLVKQLEG